MNSTPDAYSKHNNLQRSSSEKIIKEYLSLLHWKQNESILDVGAGDGSLSFEVLQRILPQDFETFMLSDISEEMVEHQKRQNKDPRIRFLVLDIGEQGLETLNTSFDHIFSFFCLHWIFDDIRHERSIANFYKMLRPGGQVFLVFVKHCYTVEFCLNMSHIKKWTKYLKDCQEYVFLYFYERDPVGKLKRILAKTQFKIDACKCLTNTYIHESMDDFLDFAMCINPIYPKLPKSEQENFREDFRIEAEKHFKLKPEYPKVCHTFQVLFACARKPT